uniref:Uncharacterized protein n=1 Tax=Glossina brevipalpis TaxID=37001 RepID=A0A1A9WEL3_9MUSC
MINAEDLKVKRNDYEYFHTEKQSQSDLSRKCSAASNDVNSITSKILIIPGLNDTSERISRFASNETVKEAENCDSEHMTTFAELRVPNWVSEGYEVVDLSEAERIIEKWGNRPPESFIKFSPVNCKKEETALKVLQDTRNAEITKQYIKKFDCKRQSRCQQIQPSQDVTCRNFRIPSGREETRDFNCRQALKPVKRTLFEDESRESLCSYPLSKQTPSRCSYIKKPVIISPNSRSCHSHIKCNCHSTNRLACSHPNFITCVCGSKSEASKYDSHHYNCRPVPSNCCHCEVIYKTSTQTNRTTQSKMCHCNFDDEKPTTSKGIQSERPDISLPSIEFNAGEKIKGSKQDLIDNIMRKLLGCDNSEINIEIKKSKRRHSGLSLNDRAAIIAKESISCQTEFTSLAPDPDSQRIQKQTSFTNSTQTQQEPFGFHRDDPLIQCRSRCHSRKKATRNKDNTTYSLFREGQSSCIENKEVTKTTRNSVESWLRSNPAHLEYPRNDAQTSASSFHHPTEINDFVHTSLSNSNYSDCQTSIAPNCGTVFPFISQISSKERSVNPKPFLRNSNSASLERRQPVIEDEVSAVEDPVDFSVGGQKISFFNDLENGPTLKIPRFVLNLREKHNSNQLIDIPFDYIESEKSEYSKVNRTTFKTPPDIAHEPNNLYFLRTNHCLFSPKSTFDQCLDNTEPYGYADSDSKCYQ